MKFSVLMSIYKNETVENFVDAIESVLNQTVLPNEIILIRDGPVPIRLQNQIDIYLEKYDNLFNYIPLEVNKGLGNALKLGVEKSKYDIIARMDTDDICIKNRFELQLEEFTRDSDLVVVGGQIHEFIDNIDNIVTKRLVPLEDMDIKRFMRRRNPINHMTVMFKKKDVLLAGNYQEMHYLEDYYLWCRLALKGVKFSNIEQTIVLARIGSEMFKRRGGYKYFSSWKALESFKVNNKLTNYYEYVSTLTGRFFIQVLFPNNVRGWALKKYSREKIEE